MLEFRKLKADEIECRVAMINQNGLQLLLYKDARCDMRLLDEVVGAENWQRRHAIIGGNLFCQVGIKMNDEWVWKEDVGTESYTEKEKGQASDAFKRACTNWGIGRELYTSPFIWIKREKANIQPNNNKYVCRDRFQVRQIAYDDDKIVGLQIVNLSNGELAYMMGQPGLKQKKEALLEQQLEEACSRAGKNPADLYAYLGVDSAKQLNADQIKEWIAKLSRKGD